MAGAGSSVEEHKHHLGCGGRQSRCQGELLPSILHLFNLPLFLLLHNYSSSSCEFVLLSVLWHDTKCLSTLGTYKWICNTIYRKYDILLYLQEEKQMNSQRDAYEDVDTNSCPEQRGIMERKAQLVHEVITLFAFEALLVSNRF